MFCLQSRQLVVDKLARCFPLPVGLLLFVFSMIVFASVLPVVSTTIEMASLPHDIICKGVVCHGCIVLLGGRRW